MHIGASPWNQILLAFSGGLWLTARMNEPSSGRVTLRDIATRLDVSHTTVSRALHGDPRITPSVRQRVEEMARQLGYRPDPMLSALAQYRRGKHQTPIGAELAWINNWSNPKQLRTYREFDLYWRGAEAEAERCGFRLEEFLLDKDLLAPRLEKILRARNIRGILIPPCGRSAPDWESFHWDDFCIVRFGYSIATPRAHLVTSDQLTDGLIAFENMWTRGYRRIGLVTYAQAVTRFSAGYFLGQTRCNATPRLPMLVLPQNKEKEDQRQLRGWITRHRPDAILTDASALRELLESAGYHVPQHLGLATLSVLDGNADAGIDQNSEEIGKAAVQLVISLLHHNECGIPTVCRELLVEGRWVDGHTLPPKIAAETSV
jgi:LacI family transcriptional regulator